MAAAVARHSSCLMHSSRHRRCPVQDHRGRGASCLPDRHQMRLPWRPLGQRALQGRALAKSRPDPIGAHGASRGGSLPMRDDALPRRSINRLARLLASGHGTLVVPTEVVERLALEGTSGQRELVRSAPSPAGSRRSWTSLSGWSRRGCRTSSTPPKPASASDQSRHPTDGHSLAGNRR